MADDEKPQYTVYRARPRLLKRRSKDGLTELRRDGGAPEYEVHGRPGRRLPALPRRRPRVPGISLGRVLRWLVAAVFVWVALSAFLFVVSAQIQETKISDEAEGALNPAGFTATTAQNILILGSDARTKSTAEPGSRIGGPSRADSILLLRTGGGASARLSIPRDTVVDIPGAGRNKINAALAIGGTALMINTVEQYLGLEINHVIEVDFENFPALIDAMGGVDVRTGCVISRINGGFRNGGFTLRLRPGENHLNGKQALALARTRKNECRPSENDLTRARRQQKIFAAVKDRVTSFGTFIRLPWVSWRAPQAVRSDMAGPSLLGLFGAVTIGGDPLTRVLKPSGTVTLPGGGAGLTVDEAAKRREVDRFLAG
jgi:LCP family protein required for cell wall assembly